MIVKQDRAKARKTRQLRVRKTVHGTPERPRLNVFRANQNIYAQIIDDTVGKTLASASTLDPEVKGRLEGNGGTIAAAKLVGEVVAKRALAAGVTKVVFDRAGYLYHGRVAALAEAAREAGLEF
jgi:large subunit ribosomal protein L18